MNKHGADPKVRKTLVRNSEQKIRDTNRAEVVYETNTRKTKSAKESSRTSFKENELAQPSLCSSESIANYMSCVKGSKASLLHPAAAEKKNDKTQLSSKITRKLNFHFNDKIYKNLVELNASIDEQKNNKREKRPTVTSSTKRDLEPNIEDFYHDEIEIDIPPNIPIIKPKIKPLKKIENGQLHQLVASFDDL